MAVLDRALGLVNPAGIRQFMNPTRAVDVVAITTQGGFTPILSNARPLSANVRERADLMKHPLEDGSSITDHIVFLPTEITLPLIIAGATFESDFQTLRQLYLAGTLLTIQTRTGAYENMVIGELPHEESSRVFDGVAVRLVLKEARIVQAEYGELSQNSVENPTHASTVKRGAQQTTAASASQASQASQTYSRSSQASQRGSTLYNLFGG